MDPLERFRLAHQGRHPVYPSAPSFAAALEDITSNDRAAREGFPRCSRTLHFLSTGRKSPT